MQKVLIAIDSEVFIDVLSDALRSEYDVYACKCGIEALKILKNVTPDTLIIDYSLCSINGLEVLKQTSYRPPVIIALTNYLSDSIIRDSQAVGVKALIRHPCTLDSILSRLSEHPTNKETPFPCD